MDRSGASMLPEPWMSDPELQSTCTTGSPVLRSAAVSDLLGAAALLMIARPMFVSAEYPRRGERSAGMSSCACSATAAAAAAMALRALLLVSSSAFSEDDDMPLSEDEEVEAHAMCPVPVARSKVTRVPLAKARVSAVVLPAGPVMLVAGPSGLPSGLS